MLWMLRQYIPTHPQYADVHNRERIALAVLTIASAGPLSASSTVQEIVQRSVQNANRWLGCCFTVRVHGTGCHHKARKTDHEDQLLRMKPGQGVRIRVDALSSDYNGYIESLPAASGAITSLLPPENATGNFVKVVQRLPVRVRFKPDQNGLDRLRPEMSAEPKVRVE
jgi:hypothetical protein